MWQNIEEKLDRLLHRYNHLADDVGDIKQDVNHIERSLKALNTKLEVFMSTVHQDIKDLTAKVDEATNAVAQRLDALSGQIKNTMTDEEVADVKATLQSEVDRLTTLGANPSNPVPPEPPATTKRTKK